MFYICRQRNAQGIATQAVFANSFEDFIARFPELEPLAACRTEGEVRCYGMGISMDRLVRENWERSVLK